MEKAVQIFSLQARGPMYNEYLAQLREECENIWKNGRQLCEAVSLTGHPCVNELHLLASEKVQKKAVEESGDEEDETRKRWVASEDSESRQSSDEEPRRRSNKKRSIKRESPTGDTRSRSNGSNGKRIPSKPHNSNIITIAASNCGEFQLERRVC